MVRSVPGLGDFADSLFVSLLRGFEGDPGVHLQFRFTAAPCVPSAPVGLVYRIPPTELVFAALYTNVFSFFFLRAPLRPPLPVLSSVACEASPIVGVAVPVVVHVVGWFGLH